MENDKILERYNSYRNEIQEYMKMLVASLEKKYNEIPESFVVSLDMLVFNLDILFRSMDEMKEKGMSDTDKYRGEKKSAAMQSFFNAQNYIHKILANFGMQPMAKSKIKDNADKLDAQKYLENLTK